MHYKYLLALLTAGLAEEFWAEARQGLIPFRDPDVYGRSVLENSSFLASSVHPDPSLHGRGFVARLSGATAEFLSMWQLAAVGPQSFTMSESGLKLTFAPTLPGWLFNEDGTLSFTFLGRVAVTIHNPKRRDLFPNGDVVIEKLELLSETGEIATINGASIAEPWASRIRERHVKRIDVYCA
jgi:hypothetical protein